MRNLTGLLLLLGLILIGCSGNKHNNISSTDTQAETSELDNAITDNEIEHETVDDNSSEEESSSSDNSNSQDSNGRSSLGVENGVSTKNAVLYDSIVISARYDAGSGINGYTDANGLFRYVEGQNVKFYVGDVFIGEGQPIDKPAGISVVTDKILTPLGLAGAGDDIGNQKALKIVRFLMALDRDHNPDNGIEINSSMVLGHHMRLLDNSVNLNTTFGNNLTLPTSIKAKEHLCQSLHRPNCIGYTQNIAHLFGQATQGDIYDNRYARYTIDENLTTYNHADEYPPDNWWQLKLPDGVKIHKIVIYNKHRSWRLANVKMYLNDSNHTVGSTDMGTMDKNLTADEMQVFTYDPPVEKSYILMQGNLDATGGDRSLHLSEVKVYGEVPIMPNYIAKFPKDNYKFGLKVNAPIDTIIGKVSALNYAQKDLTYSIIGSVPFAIDAKSGEIKLASTVNYNQTQSYSFQVKVNDGTNSNSVDVTVKLLSINGVRLERWNGIYGGYVSNLTDSSHFKNDNADMIKIISQLEDYEATVGGNEYGQRLTAI